MSKTKKWYSFAENERYSGDEPCFFDVSDKPWKKLLENNYSLILKELQQLINENNKNIIPYFNQTLASTPSSWTIFPLVVWDKKYEDNCKKVPATVNILSQVQGLTSCSFSILKPHTKIKPHFGDSNVMYRCHLTLKSNATLPEMGLRVGTETISWETGKLFSFCDAYNHEAWNNTANERWVLIIDVLREEFIAEKEQICAEINATLWWQLKFQKFYFIKHLPKWRRKRLLNVTALFMKN